jgi:serine/threonine-protein kinase
MGILAIASYLVVGLSQVTLLAPLLMNWAGEQQTVLLASNSTSIPIESLDVFRPLGELVETQCRDAPTGVGIPAFQPGIAKADVVRMLGFPTGTARGYWPNTRAVFYELIPDEVSLGFLFDRTTERIRQTEASFTSTVESRLVSLTLNGMLGCRLNDQIQQGLQRVWQRETQQFSFTLGSLKGIIQRQKGDRLYIGIWEADLH